VSTSTGWYEFITPWTPSKPVYVDKLKGWLDDDMREVSLARDLAAHQALAELLDDSSSRDLRIARQRYKRLADLGYAGYFYFDFARVSMRELIKVYEILSMKYVGDPSFKTYYQWNWREDLLDDAKPGSESQARIIFKNPEEAAGDATLFGKLMFFDTRYGVPADETEKHLVDSVAEEFTVYHPDYRVFGLSSRDLLILSAMDMVNLLSPQPDFEKLPRRIAYFRGYRDAGAGRVFPHPTYPPMGDLVGRFWINTDTSLGLDTDTGYDDLRVGISLGAESA
jgi:hypothetical protein